MKLVRTRQSPVMWIIDVLLTLLAWGGLVWLLARGIGAMLETDRAEADKKIAQAKAEERRAMAVATEQEMKAKVMEMKAKLVDSETQVPLAMADALRTGKLGVMDYYNLQNVKADTQMRSELGNPDAGTSNT